MSMSIAMGPAVAITLPAAAKDLNIQSNDLQWIINAFSISSACCLLLFGRLADLYGRKRIWLIGYLIMAAFGLGAGFSQSDKVLYVLRGIQGVGAAAVIPAALGILAKSFPPSPARSLAFATFSAGAPLGAVFGFVIGSVLTQLTNPTWRSPMYLFSGIAFAFTTLGFFVIDKDEPSTEEDQRVDWIGAALITAGLVLVVFVLGDLPTAHGGWKNARIISLFVVGVVLTVLFVAWQYYLERRLENPELPRTAWTAPPLMKLSMWKRARGRFAVMQLIACMNWAAFTCWTVWVQLYYQTYLGLSPIKTMLRVLPMFFMGITANVIIALTIARIDVVFIVAAGTLLTGCACVFFAVIDTSAPYWAFGFPSACLIVLGADFTFASGTLFISKVSLPHEQSVGGALFQAMTQIGSAVGLSSRHLGVIVDHEADNAPLPAQLKAYKAAMWTGFAFGIVCTMLSVFLRGVGVVGQKTTSAEERPTLRSATESATADLEEKKSNLPI
ncbi:efflux transporter [Gloeopeniophorella convolvens]|nr:efflux transporter [Gloeopeniophorella convolvens]